MNYFTVLKSVPSSGRPSDDPASVLFLVRLAALSVLFDYPKVLDSPAAEILTRFAASAPELTPLWYGMALSALLLIPTVMLVRRATGAQGVTGDFMVIAGVLAGCVQMLGLLRWTFLVPDWAAEFAGPGTDAASQKSIEMLFWAFHDFLGRGMGEHLDYLFTAVWTILAAWALWLVLTGVKLIIGAKRGR